ncbi:MAG: hypothetical protein KJ725_09495 [Gammaproteobacteria bacterium]|nr:hypothetical protein [Gammaproteobacteria bacterium]
MAKLIVHCWLQTMRPKWIMAAEQVETNKVYACPVACIEKAWDQRQ